MELLQNSGVLHFEKPEQMMNEGYLGSISGKCSSSGSNWRRQAIQNTKIAWQNTKIAWQNWKIDKKFIHHEILILSKSEEGTFSMQAKLVLALSRWPSRIFVFWVRNSFSSFYVYEELSCTRKQEQFIEDRSKYVKGLGRTECQREQVWKCPVNLFGHGMLLPNELLRNEGG